MSNVSIVLRKKPNTQNECPLAIRVTKDRKSIYHYTGKYIPPALWDDTRKLVKKGKGVNSTLLNNYLSKQKSLVLDEVLSLEASGKDYSLNELKRKLDKGNTGNSFIKFAEQYFSVMEDAGNYNRLTAESPALNHFKAFCQNKDIEFKDITVYKLEKFKAYLTATLDISERTIFNYLIVIRTIYNRAIKNGLVDKSYYPFGENGMRLRRPKSQKIGLDISAIKQLEEFTSDKDIENHAKSVFLFSFYFAGIRASDVLQIKWNDIFDGRLHYIMGKNKKPGSIKIPQKAIEIINQYESQTKGQTFVFPDMEKMSEAPSSLEFKKYLKIQIARINKALKAIGEQLDLPIKLTMHIARHSFATISGDKIPIQRLQQLYRHSSISTTIGYQNAFMNKGTDEALDKVLDY